VEAPFAIFAEADRDAKRGTTMKKSYRCWFLALVVMAIGVPNLQRQQFARAQTAGAAVAQAKPTEIQVPGALIPTRFLAQGPAETVTEPQTCKPFVFLHPLRSMRCTDRCWR